ncbi:MAG: hypothetical protein JNM47_06485 [Hyphomonadaceae bacterium]|nr:hypothetical protein [Hyphomonadaceae bacterium]
MLTMTPVVAAPSHSLPFAWAKADPAHAWLALSGASEDADIALLVGILARGNDVPAGATLVEAIDLLGEAAPFTVDGGLIIRAGDFGVEPGCCGVLSDWRGWVDLAPGAPTPWMGHDPAPWVETAPEVALIHADGGTENDRPVDGEHIRVSYAEIAEALAAAVGDLEGFQARLEDWLARHAPQDRAFGPRFWDAFVRQPETACA